jgi:hypothetical protein
MIGLFEQARMRGEKRLARLAAELLQNERFLGAVEAALNAKGYLERRIQSVLHTMSMASRLDVDELARRLGENERKMRQLARRLEALQTQVDDAAARSAKPEKPARGAAEPAVQSGPAAAPEAEAARRGARKPAAEAPASASGAAAPSGAEVLCPACSRPFQKKTYNQRYCSAACRSAA